MLLQWADAEPGRLTSGQINVFVSLRIFQKRSIELFSLFKVKSLLMVSDLLISSYKAWAGAVEIEKADATFMTVDSFPTIDGINSSDILHHSCNSSLAVTDQPRIDHLLQHTGQDQICCRLF